jgi:hypothetical protein
MSLEPQHKVRKTKLLLHILILSMLLALPASAALFRGHGGGVAGSGVVLITFGTNLMTFGSNLVTGP